MKEKLFAELIESAEDVLEHAKGRRDLRTTVLPPEPKPVTTTEIKRLRTQLKASQSVFAHYCNVSTKLVQAWEAGLRKPDGPALLLLRLMERAPQGYVNALYVRETSPRYGVKR